MAGEETGVPIDGKVPNAACKADSSKKRKQVCRFHGTKGGCRAGDSCRFQHPAPTEAPASSMSQSSASARAPVPPENSNQTSSAKPTTASAPPKVVAKPTPKALMDDPRAFQLMQIQRRFKPIISENADATTLTFDMKPTDPDFPYDLEAIECTLSVPKSYPGSAKPKLTVRNKDIPRGFQINIEQGFDRIVAASPSAYLLGLLNRLDQQLESILSGKKADTITLVSNRGPPSKAEAHKPSMPTPQLTPTPSVGPSAQELDQANTKRQADVRQLEARFGRLPHYAKSADGMTYTLPLDSPKRSTWPGHIQMLRSFQLRVPDQYPLEPLEIRLFNDSTEAKQIEKSFRERSHSNRMATITHQVNYLSSHVKEMTVAAPEAQQTIQTQIPPVPVPPTPSTDTRSDSHTRSGSEKFEDSHVKHIPRPPEWDMQTGSDDDSDSDSYDSEENSEDGDKGSPSEAQEPQPPPSTAPAERGILLSFPRLELHGIELLELTSLNLTVKCERCKETLDVEKLRTSLDTAKMREVSCKKCAATLAVRFRADLIHLNSVRAGYLDLDGCTVVDMLPSSFMPTCAQCSMQYPSPGVVAVRGDNSIAICRECHTKMSMKIQEIKFLLISASALRASRAPGRKKPKENLGIVAGTELPNRGRCSHYKKSYRWFRFSCCSKVYPCDRCHDEQNDHPIEHANRMLCGYCSREQNYRPEDCSSCHAALTGSKGRGFWEGGKGTRDPARMSRKDPRKFRNRNKTKPVKG